MYRAFKKLTFFFLNQYYYVIDEHIVMILNLKDKINKCLERRFRAFIKKNKIHFYILYLA